MEARLDKIWQKAGEMGKVYWLKTFGLHKGKDPKVFTAPCRVSNRDFDVEVFSDLPGGVSRQVCEVWANLFLCCPDKISFVWIMQKQFRECT